MQVLDAAGNERYWKVSRAGEANPPHASSCWSGDGTCKGYPLSFGRMGADTWTFWFDWVSKARVRVSGMGNRLTAVYFLGELSGTGGVAGDVTGPRTALATYRVTGSSVWQEPASAEAISYNGASCPAYGVNSPGYGPPRNDGKAYHKTDAGSSIACDADGNLW